MDRVEVGKLTWSEKVAPTFAQLEAYKGRVMSVSPRCPSKKSIYRTDGVRRAGPRGGTNGLGGFRVCCHE